MFYPKEVPAARVVPSPEEIEVESVLRREDTLDGSAPVPEDQDAAIPFGSCPPTGH